MTRIDERRQAVAQTVAQIRAIEARDGVNPDALALIRQQLIAEDFPPPQAVSGMRSALYRLSEDEDHRFALYANASLGGYGTPAHNHTTWAVIVGVTGEELNRFYQPTPEGGVRESGQFMVKAGTGVSFMPDDLHSIHIDAPLINFHMYGLGLEQLDKRRYYKAQENVWSVFPPHSDIREAR
jgi:predicted metal-dependent enzyme (double-stranded beta helix superfamily)